MKAEKNNILSIMADGRPRCFNAIQLEVGLESTKLQKHLNALTDRGLVEQTILRDDDLYRISFWGTLAVQNLGPESNDSIYA